MTAHITGHAAKPKSADDASSAWLFEVVKAKYDEAAIPANFFKLLGEHDNYIRSLAQKYDANIPEEELQSKGVVISYEPVTKT